ncbi:glycoside hydrolase family 36 protein [Nonomuraea typhae]|uniref:glycoside hydrolase family 36 protein n=1 Tax=Nonomuraea typhae TaxID=2603600 RepID=UPI001C66F1DC|nr:glycoside hydrolase family 36 protein [Nonomuraea typhae]
MSVTTAGLAPAPTAPLLDDVRLAVLPASARWELTPGPGGAAVLEIHSEEELEIRLSVPLGDAVGFWHPDCRWSRTIVADWAGRAETSLVKGAAAGCLYDSAGETMLTFAAADPVPESSMRFGVSEENKVFVVHLRVPGGLPYRLLLAPRAASVATAMRLLRSELAERLAGLAEGPAALAGGPPGLTEGPPELAEGPPGLAEGPPGLAVGTAVPRAGLAGETAGAGRAPVPEAARVPVYSTWYGFSQAVEAAAVEEEARLAAELGCGVVIVDDGWQEKGNGRGYAGVGDWRPDVTKFPDLAGHVARVQALGLTYMLWVAPLLLGAEADCFDRLAQYAPASGGSPGARVLDPRHPEVRRHVVETCARLVRDYGLDGLKIDFLDEAMVYAGKPAHGDVTDVGVAMRLLLTEVRQALGPGKLTELRQPYTGPGMAGFGTMLRADDCPADAVANRVRTIDVGLLAVGGAVHADMLMWDPAAPPASAARQLIGALHAVPQISARLAGLSADHRAMLRFWLAQWRRLRPLLLDGEVEPGRPDELYPVVRAERGDACVITVSAARVAALDTARHRKITLVNGTAAPRLVLEVTGPGGAFATVVHDAAGRIIERAERRLEPGLSVLSVPPSGLAILEGTP